MMPALLKKILSSMNKETTIVLGVITVLFVLPIITLMSITDVGALADPSNSLYTGSASKTNTYIYGFCTFWAAKRREEVGLAIPNNWGDAHSWEAGARAINMTIDHTPSVNAIMQTNVGALGHVAFVEKVEADGTWEISEMNFKWWDVVSSRKLKADDARFYNFIH